MPETSLLRGLGRRDVTAVAINAIIGAGIFGLPSKVAALIGTYSLLAFAACALVVALIVLCYAEVSSRFHRTGGPYLYAREAFGPAVAFEVGWLYWIVRVTTFAANCNLFGTYLAFFFPALGAGVGRVAVIVSVTIVLTLINLFGLRQTRLFTNVFTIGKLVPLAAFVVIGMFFVRPENFALGSAPSYDDFSRAVLLLIYASVGFELAVIPAGEIREPENTVPFALIAALITVAVLYMLIQIVSMGTLPGIATSERPIADAARTFSGAAGAAIITVGALISIAGNLNVSLLSATRLIFGMAENGEMPSALARTHPRFRTPHISILITALFTLVLTVQSTFVSALTIATVTRLLVYATTCASLPVFRRRTEVPSARFAVPLGSGIALLSLVLIVWLLSNVNFSVEAPPIIVAAAAGLILFYLLRGMRKAKELRTSAS